jgi:molybdate transport system regulatory protein
MAKQPSGHFAIRSKIWLEDDGGEVIFGLGRYRMLDAVDRTGSLHAAARELNMSYRAIWCRIRASEKRLGKTLVVRAGRGSRLTPFAVRLMKQFNRLQTLVNNESDDIFKMLMSDFLP